MEVNNVKYSLYIHIYIYKSVCVCARARMRVKETRMYNLYHLQNTDFVRIQILLQESDMILFLYYIYIYNIYKNKSNHFCLLFYC